VVDNKEELFFNVYTIEPMDPSAIMVMVIFVQGDSGGPLLWQKYEKIPGTAQFNWDKIYG
jgi:hypothetical protein